MSLTSPIDKTRTTSGRTYIPVESMYSSRSQSAIGSSRARAMTPLSDLPTNEILPRVRQMSETEKRRQQREDDEVMNQFNPFSRPRASMEYPNRSVFLDPKVNNFARCKTRTELLKQIKSASIPHRSYDIDGDGYVSQDDYRLAKRFDFDGNGLIDPYEKKVAQHVIADEFFKKHRDNIHVFGPKIANATHKENVRALETANNFERTLNTLKQVEDSLRGRSSEEMLSCMESVDHDIIKHNFFTDKSVANAWTSTSAIPMTSRTLVGPHNGSRKRLLESRRMRSREECSSRLQKAYDSQPQFSAQKVALITSSKFW
eukprot:CAMPEP_0185018442 /NCGR_PEP_ID=MMETSP1103-20130426/1165_1 /TAXON_ID=36769 /ORGANISM="Paraphysomonas bandaiensis, Strain Caron Lab Isolate" /LENGTH=315 /DNA_ID=CAMNT_0027548255 /DNA_START=283 /DNA_END=1230 /DNA_ORIENTATION=+